MNGLMSVVVRQGEMRIERARRLMNERSGFGRVAWLVKDWFWGIGRITMRMGLSGKRTW